MRWSRHRPPPPGLGPGVASRLMFLGSLFVLLYVAMIRIHHDPNLPGSFLRQFVGADADSAEAITIPAAESIEVPPVSGAQGVVAAVATELPEAKPPAKEAAPRAVNPLDLKAIDECAEVNRALLAEVRDKTPKRPEEAEAIWHLLCVASTTPPAQLAARSNKDVRFKHLFNSPAQHRGELVRVRGVLARLDVNPIDPDGNVHGLRQYYEGWIFPEDQYLNPYVVLFTSLPPGLKPGESMREEVTVDGFFLKLHAFRNREGKVLGAPLLIASTLQQRVVDRSYGTMEAVVLAIAFAGLMLVASVIFWWFNSRDAQLADQFRTAAGPDAVALSPFDAPSFTDTAQPNDPSGNDRHEASPSSTPTSEPLPWEPTSSPKGD